MKKKQKAFGATMAVAKEKEDEDSENDVLVNCRDQYLD